MKISNEVRTGILGVLALVIFILGFNFLKGTGVFSSSRSIKVKYKNTQGLVEANYVLLNGYKVGAINDIFMDEDDDGLITVSMAVDKDVRIPKDSKATIISEGVLGTKAVQLELGTSSEDIKKNEFLKGNMEEDMIAAIAESTTDVMDKVENSLAELDKLILGLNNTLDLSTQNNLKNAVADVHQITTNATTLTRDAQVITQDVQVITKDAQSSMKQFNDLAHSLNNQKDKISTMASDLTSFTGNLKKNNESITNIVRNTEQTTAKLSQMELEQTVNNLNSTLSNLQTTLAKVNNGDGSMAMLMNDDKLYKNLKNTMGTLNNLLYDISARPKRYINFSVFGKKNKDNAAPVTAPDPNR